jgi:hypothetical protein
LYIAMIGLSPIAGAPNALFGPPRSGKQYRDQ